MKFSLRESEIHSCGMSEMLPSATLWLISQAKSSTILNSQFSIILKRHTVRPETLKGIRFGGKIANCEAVAVLEYSSASKERRK